MMKRCLGLLLWGGLLPHWLSAQISADTCCRPPGRGPQPGPALRATVLPTCYPPVLAVAEPLLYDTTQATQPVFVWKSGTPIYAADEQFQFRLVALPANQPVFEQTTTAHRLDWPPALVLPTKTTHLQYTVRASRQDRVGQRCFSADVQGNVWLRPAAQQALRNGPAAADRPRRPPAYR